MQKYIWHRNLYTVVNSYCSYRDIWKLWHSFSHFSKKCNITVFQIDDIFPQLLRFSSGSHTSQTSHWHLWILHRALKLHTPSALALLPFLPRRSGSLGGEIRRAAIGVINTLFVSNFFFHAALLLLKSMTQFKETSLYRMFSALETFELFRKHFFSVRTLLSECWQGIRWQLFLPCLDLFSYVERRCDCPETMQEGKRMRSICMRQKYGWVEARNLPAAKRELRCARKSVKKWKIAKEGQTPPLLYMMYIYHATCSFRSNLSETSWVRWHVTDLTVKSWLSVCDRCQTSAQNC